MVSDHRHTDALWGNGRAENHVHAAHAVQSNMVEMPFKLVSAGSGIGGSPVVLRVMGLGGRVYKMPCSRMKPLQHIYKPVQRPSKPFFIFFWALSWDFCLAVSHYGGPQLQSSLPCLLHFPLPEESQGCTHLFPVLLWEFSVSLAAHIYQHQFSGGKTQNLSKTGSKSVRNWVGREGREFFL